MTYEELVVAVGPGFHPDTPGEGYVSLPDGVTVETYELVVNEAFAASNALLAPDPYTRALGVAIEKGWVTE